MLNKVFLIQLADRSGMHLVLSRILRFFQTEKLENENICIRFGEVIFEMSPYPSKMSIAKNYKTICCKFG